MVTEIEKKKSDETILLGLDIDLGKKVNHDLVIEALDQLEEVEFVTEIF